jgi:hypothetical protein
MVLEEAARSLAPVAVKEPHFAVFPEFREASYARRYEIMLTKLVRERLYDNAALLLSSRASVETGAYRQPSTELSFESLLDSLRARAMAIANRSN